MRSLLPPNSTQLERDVEQVVAAALNMDVPIRDLWNADKCPAQLLPWLAWAMSVEPWDEYWPVWRQREVIKASIGLHNIKGTVAAVRQVLAATGFGDVTILENIHRPGRDGSVTRNGNYYYGWAQAWAKYRVILSKPISNLQAVLVHGLLAESDRAVSELDGLDYTAVAHTHNGAFMRDGLFNRGVV